MNIISLEVEDFHTYFVGAEALLVHNYNEGDGKNKSTLDADGGKNGNGGKTTDIPWSSNQVANAAKDLQNGAKSVEVANRSQAEELFFRLFQGDGYKNVSGLDAMDAKNLLGGKGNTYHWDDLFGSDGLLLGHGANNLDSMMRHLQIHPEGGKVIRIFFE